MSQELSESFEWAHPHIEEYKQLAGGAKLYRVRAIHVTMTGNRRRYTLEELRLAGRSLTERPININHKFRLPYPENRTLDSEFNEGERWVETITQVSDPMLNKLIAERKVRHVSIDGRARDHREVDGIEPIGVAFTGLAFVTDSEIPGDPLTTVELMETVQEVELKEIMSFGEPFAGYKDFAHCVAENRDKEDPEAYCASIMRKVEGETVHSDAGEAGSQKLGEEKEMTDEKSKVETPPPAELEPITTLEELLDTLPDEAFENIEEVKKWLQKVRARMVKKGTVGTFTAAAKKAGMTVAAYARKILANKSKYDTTMIKRAVFALRAQKGFKDTVDDEFIKEVLAKPLDDDSEFEIEQEKDESPPPSVSVQAPTEIRAETKMPVSQPKPPEEKMEPIGEALKRIQKRSIERDDEILSKLQKTRQLLEDAHGGLKKEIAEVTAQFKKAIDLLASKNDLADAVSKASIKGDATIGEVKKALLDRIEIGEKEADASIKTLNTSTQEANAKLGQLVESMTKLQEAQATVFSGLKEAEERQKKLAEEQEAIGKTTTQLTEVLQDRDVLARVVPFKGSGPGLNADQSEKKASPDWAYEQWKRKFGLGKPKK